MVGRAGGATPTFGQSLRAAIVCIAALPPDDDGQAIITKAGTGIEKAVDLKGKRGFVGKGVI